VITKTASGLVFLDQPFGGIFAGRCALICGRSGTGKTIASLQFVQQGVQQEERALVLTTMPADDWTILAEAMGFRLSEPVDRGHLILLEYSSFVPGQSLDWNTIPAEGFDQLREIIETNSISRVVLDTVLPWICVGSAEHMAKHIFSFVRSFDRLGVTTLMTLPKPVSAMAFRLKKALESVVPISVLLSPEEDETEYFNWKTVKYLGEKGVGTSERYTIEKTSGLTPFTGTVPVPDQQAPPPPAPPEASNARVRFSSKIGASVANPEKAANRPSPTNERKGPARLSSVWKPE
jgi:KaiC/GvpD/RAD55 family RecA-like ATPase